MARPLPPELREFVYRYCPSPLALAVLLHVHAHADREWTPRELHREVPDLDEGPASDVLAAFYGQGLLAALAVDRYRYQPRTTELGQLADTLAKTYAERPAAVLDEVAAVANMAPLRSFADAFVIKRGPKHG